MDMTSFVLYHTLEMQKISAPTFQEENRARYVEEQFQEAGLANICMDSIGNVYGRIPGGSENPVVISSHLDTVHPIQTDLTVKNLDDRIIGPGIGDNTLGVAALLGIAANFKNSGINLAGDLWLVADVCEEGLGNLRGARAMVERFGSHPLAYIILEGIGLGRIFNRGLGVARYRISIRTPGGHAWSNYGSPSAIHEIAYLITQLEKIPIPENPRTSWNVGVITGGISVNSIASEASLELDLRSEASENLDRLKKRVLEICGETGRRKNDVRVSHELIGVRPAGGISDDHPLVVLTREMLEKHGVASQTGIASTDANVPLSMGYPAVCIGLTRGGNSHTTQEFILKESLSTGLAFLMDFIPRIWGM